VPKNCPRLEIERASARIRGIYDCIVVDHAWFLFVQQVALPADLESARQILDLRLERIFL